MARRESRPYLLQRPLQPAHRPRFQRAEPYPRSPRSYSNHTLGINCVRSLATKGEIDIDIRQNIHCFAVDQGRLVVPLLHCVQGGRNEKRMPRLDI